MTDDLGSRDGESLRGSGTSPWADMIEATRLTGLGRLDEATALIQRSLGGAPQARRDAPAPDARPGTDRDSSESGPRVREVVGRSCAA